MIAPDAVAVLISILPSLVAVPAVTVRLVPACAVSSWVEPVLVISTAPAARMSGRLAATPLNPPSPVISPPLARSVTLLVVEVSCPARMLAPAVSRTSPRADVALSMSISPNVGGVKKFSAVISMSVPAWRSPSLARPPVLTVIPRSLSGVASRSPSALSASLPPASPVT